MKKKVNIKKLFTTISSMLLITAILSSCGTKEVAKSTTTEPAKTEDTAKEATEESTEAKEGEREKVGVMYKEGLPIVDPGDYTFSIFVDANKEDTDFVMMPILEEQTGVKVEIEHYPYAVAKEKLVLKLNSGDYADAIGGWTLSEFDILNLGVDEGVYIPIDGYIDEYAPIMKGLLELEGVRETMTAPDGHIYSPPYVMFAPQVDFSPTVNTRWLKNVGMEMPTTTEEFKEVLKAFKTQDANGNGDANDEIPFTADPDNRKLGYLTGWFGVSVDKYGFTMVGDELTFGANTEEYKQGIKYLADLYAEGLIDPEIFTQDKAQWQAKGAKDIYGVALGWSSGELIKYDAGVRPDFDPLPVLTNPNGVQPVYFRNTYKTDILKNQLVITDKAEQPEIIVRWFDNFFEPDNAMASQGGPIGITVFKEGDKYRKINVAEMSLEDQKKYEWGNLWMQSLPKHVPLRLGSQAFIEDPAPYDEKTPTDALYEPFLTEAIPKYWVNSDDASRLSDLMTGMENFLKEKNAAWISGQVDIDADWDSYIAQLEKIKLQELITLRLDALK